MRREISPKKYQKKMDYSYTLGAFPTIELLKYSPDKVIQILIHEDMNSETQKKLIVSLCREHEIPCRTASRQVEKLRDKENCFVIGLFDKYRCNMMPEYSHVVLVNPSDSGNMGTMIRTCVGFGINDLAVIEPAVDLFHPKVIRASMGAIFKTRFAFFGSFEEYRDRFGQSRGIYPFMLKGSVELQNLKRSREERFSLVFGNEAKGLGDEFLDYGQSVCIRHSDQIDSLNLSIALGIGLYEFTRQQEMYQLERR